MWAIHGGGEGRRIAWLGFYALVLTAWATLFLMQPALDLPQGWQAIGMDYLASLCRPAADAGLLGLTVMWSVMALAMMVPTTAPALKTYMDLTHTSGATRKGLAALLGGYMVIWAGFSLGAALLQTSLNAASLLDPLGRSTAWLVNAGLLTLAGAYQFSRLKDACLNQCRSPMMFFMANWKDGPSGAFRLGLRLGTVCLGCCWALMLLAFVAGTMNLAFMGLAMVLMTLEKLPQTGRYLSAPTGAVLLLSAGAVILSQMMKIM